MNKEIDYLKEHLYEIYKYKKSMKDLTYDIDLEHLLRTCKALDYSQKEINRLNNIIDETTKYVKSLSSSGRGCDIYDDIKKEILNKLKGDNK